MQNIAQAFTEVQRALFQRFDAMWPRMVEEIQTRGYVLAAFCAAAALLLVAAVHLLGRWLVKHGSRDEDIQNKATFLLAVGYFIAFIIVGAGVGENLSDALAPEVELLRILFK